MCVDVNVREDVLNLHASATGVGGDGACILACGCDRTVHDDILERTGEVGDQRSVVSLYVHDDGEFVAVAVEAAVEPVARVEDEAARLGGVLDVVCHLQAELTTFFQTVHTLCQVDVCC